MATKTYTVDGMTCEHCVRAVTSELSALNGVSSVDVDLGNNGPSRVTVESVEPLAPRAVAAAIDEARYVLHTD